MRIRADEHISPHLVEAVRHIALSPGWELDSVFDSGDRGATDTHWITRFADSGGDAILTADTDFIKTPAQVVAVTRTGIKVIHLPAKFGSAKLTSQAAHVLLWWPQIEQQILDMRRRECFQPPWNISEPTKLKKIDINFAEAEKKHKKASRRSQDKAP